MSAGSLQFCTNKHYSRRRPGSIYMLHSVATFDIVPQILTKYCSTQRKSAYTATLFNCPMNFPSTLLWRKFTYCFIGLLQEYHKVCVCIKMFIFYLFFHIRNGRVALRCHRTNCSNSTFRRSRATTPLRGKTLENEQSSVQQ